MHYFYKEDAELSPGGEVALEPEDVWHAFRVLRLRRGDPVAVADGRGGAFRGIIIFADARSVLVRLSGPVSPAESPLPLTLLQGVARGEKMDLVVRQAVELGVNRIVPVITERSVPRFDGAGEERRLKRWRKIARAAAAQCRRAVLPRVEPVLDFAGAAAMIPGRYALVPWEEEKKTGIARVLRETLPPEPVLIFIGPEGGFSPSEIEVLIAAGARTVHLGPRILRTETAAAVTLALVQSAWGDLGVLER